MQSAVVLFALINMLCTFALHGRADDFGDAVATPVIQHLPELQVPTAMPTGASLFRSDVIRLPLWAKWVGHCNGDQTHSLTSIGITSRRSLAPSDALTQTQHSLLQV